MRRFGTFEGVFTPTLLTILGVIMYLRLGWVVGEAGLGGAILIILMANVVSLSTALAISTLATNKKVGAGGAYYLISRSLGLEVGSSIGIPLYLSQALSGAMYIIGFTEAWTALFPQHPFKVTASVVLVILACLSLWSAKWAMKVQYLIMAVLIGSLVSIFLGDIQFDSEIVLWNSSKSVPFWAVFAIFFPAVTGIEAGAAMSGEVKDPARSLPRGILSAVLVSLMVYLGLAVWLYFMASAEELKGNYTIVLQLAKWKIAVIAGILGATLSSALGSLLGAPRTLAALGRDKALPFSRFWALQTKGGEPWSALIFSVLIIEACILLADLNTIAPLLTMFFLITYGMVNTVVAVEQGLGILSFRPIFRIPVWITWVGALWCFVIMFLIDPLFAAVAFVCTLGIYIVQVKRGVHAQWGDVRSGVFNAIAEWALQVSLKLPRTAKTWKPNLLVLADNPVEWKGHLELIRDLVLPHGTVRFLHIEEGEVHLEKRFTGILKRFISGSVEESLEKKEEADNGDDRVDAEELAVAELCRPLRELGIFTAGTVVETKDFVEAFNIVCQTMKSAHFPPNLLFLTFSETKSKDMEKVLAIAIREEMGIMLYRHHPKAGLGLKKTVNIWTESLRSDLDLILLTGYQLGKAWRSETRIIHPAKDEEDCQQAERILRKIGERIRMPNDTDYHIPVGTLEETIASEPHADLNLFILSTPPKWKEIHKVVQLSQSSCLFLRGSGQESFNV